MNYKQYKNTNLWIKIDNLVSDLEKNKDLNISTDRDYVIGYLAKNLGE